MKSSRPLYIELLAVSAILATLWVHRPAVEAAETQTESQRFLVIDAYGRASEACAMTYEIPPAKIITFTCCEGDPQCPQVFWDGFE